MSPTVGSRVPARYSGRIPVRGRVLECADAKGRWPVAREGVKHLHHAFAVLSSCDSECGYFFVSCLREPVGQPSPNGNDRK